MRIPRPRDKQGKPTIPCKYVSKGCRMKFYTKTEKRLHEAFCDKAPQK